MGYWDVRFSEKTVSYPGHSLNTLIGIIVFLNGDIIYLIE